MNIWMILGIEETKDKEEIKKAYRMKLTMVNPEDDPDGFMRLREAYDEAVRLADESEPEEAQEEAMSEVEHAIDAIYQDYYKRIDVKCWEELFASDYFTSLEQSADSFEKLMVYIMNHSRLPDKVFKLIVDTFDIVQKRQELAEIFPDDFLDFVISNATYEDIINYYMFEGDVTHVDAFIDLYFELRKAIGRRNYDEAEDYFNQLDKLPVSHPYVQKLRINMEFLRICDTYNEDAFVISGEDAEKVNGLKEELSTLVKEYPEDNHFLSLLGDMKRTTGNYDAAREVYEHILNNNAKNLYAMECIADLCYRQEDYETARDKYRDLVELSPYNANIREGLYKANIGVIETGKKKLEEDPDDYMTKQEMAWSCYLNGRNEEGVALLDTFEPTKKEQYRYYNVKSRMYIQLKAYEEALSCLLKWKSAIEEITDSGEGIDKELYDKKKRYPYVKGLIGECYKNLGRYDEALEILKDAIEADSEERPFIYETLCDLLYRMRSYDECIRQCDAAIGESPDNYWFHICKAKACYEREYLREALEECNRAIYIFPYTLDAYVYKIKIYQWVEQYDDADSVIAQYKQLMPASDTMKYYQALNVKYRGDEQAAEKILEELKADYNAEQSDLEDYTDALCLLADVYDDLDKNQESIDLYYEVLELKPDHLSVHGYLGYMYKKIFKYRKSIEEYDKQIEIRAYPNHFINRGLAYKRLDKYSEAINDFKTAIEMEPDDWFCYNQIAQIYYLTKDFEQAIEWYDKGLEVVMDSQLRYKLEMIRWKARALAGISRYQESVELMQTTLDTYGDENDYQVRYELALTYTRLDRFDLARKVLEEYIEHGKDEDERYWYMSLLMELTGEEGCLAESRELYKRAAALKPDSKKIHGLMGRIFTLNKCYEEAREAFSKALDDELEGSDDYTCEYLELVSLCEGDLSSDYDALVDKAREKVLCYENAKQYIKLARLHRARKEYNTALEWIEKAIKAGCFGCGYGDCEEGYYELGITYQRIGDLEKAKEAFEKAILVHGHCGIYDEKLAECSR